MQKNNFFVINIILITKVFVKQNTKKEKIIIKYVKKR